MRVRRERSCEAIRESFPRPTRPSTADPTPKRGQERSFRPRTASNLMQLRHPSPLATAPLSRRVEKVVGYPPLAAPRRRSGWQTDEQQRRALSLCATTERQIASRIGCGSTPVVSRTPMPLDSPRPVERFFGADARGDIDAIVALFTDDAVVVDERQTWQGRDGIRQWQDGPAARYEYTTELEKVSRTGEDRYRVSGRIDGNFPGGTARLNWDFTIAGELIRRLEIAP